MNPEEKPRSDSKLDNLPEPQFMELRDGLIKRTFKSYEEAKSWLATECGVSVATSALTKFWQRHCWPVVRERRQYSVMCAEALGDAMKKDPVNWDDKIIDRTKQRTFEFLDSETLDPKAAADLLNSIIKARKQAFTEKIQTKKQQIEERRLEILEKKAALTDQANAITGDATLTEEEKAARIKQLFRM